jgi:hypothetical protein
MKRLLNRITDTLADAALQEMGVNVATSTRQTGTMRETLEENLIEVAFAEAADYEDIHNAIMREHQSELDIAHPNECRYGDKDMCFV